MTDLVSRQEVLDMLSKGKINIDEALVMLNQSDQTNPESAGETVFKADELTDPEDPELGSEADEIKAAEKIPVDLIPEKIEKSPEYTVDDENKSRWLRIKVTNLETGKNKVSVNVPWGIVNFGLDLANLFSPKSNSGEFEKLRKMTSNAEQGLLLDVEDSDSNEHVQIYID